LTFSSVALENIKHFELGGWTMGDEIRALAIEYNKAFGEGRLDRVREMLHPDVEFDGTAKPTHGRDDYMSGLPRLVSVLERNELHDVIVEGNRVFILYDFVTASSAGRVLSGELLTFEGGLITKITLLFDHRRWSEVIAEIQRRAQAAPA
jgi:SnoaL-like domain